MDQESLVTERIEAGERFLAELEKAIPLKTAFWCKETEDSRWILQIASDRFSEEDHAAARRELYRVAKDIGDPNFNVFAVQFAKMDDPLVRHVMEIRRLYPGRFPAHYRGRHYEAGYVEELYIYPLPINVPSPAPAAGS